MVISQSGRTKIFIDCGIILAFRREVGFDMCFAGRIAFFLGNPHFQKIILQVQCSCIVGKLCGWTLDLIMIGRAGPLNVAGGPPHSQSWGDWQDMANGIDPY